MECEFFVKCDNPATHYYQHPVLGKVPTCARCLEHVGIAVQGDPRVVDMGTVEALRRIAYAVLEWIDESGRAVCIRDGIDDYQPTITSPTVLAEEFAMTVNGMLGGYGIAAVRIEDGK